MTQPIGETYGREKKCAACGSSLRLSDKFCRRCGENQERMVAEHAAPDSSLTTGFSAHLNSRADRYQTAPLKLETISQSISGLLIKALAPKLTSDLSVSKLSKKIILSLMSIPVWLIIVLLSPLDAWATTRELTRQL